MPKIVVVDLNHVTVDGVTAGSVCDVLANHDPGVVLNPEADDSGFRSALLAALSAWGDARIAEHEATCKSIADAHLAEDAKKDEAHAAALAKQSEEHATATATLQAEHKISLKSLQGELTDAIAKWDDKECKLRAQIGEQQAMVDALGGTEAGRKMACGKRRQALQETLDRAAAELANLPS